MFVHIKAFTRVPKRLELNQRLRFEVRICANGKKRAINVQVARTRRAARGNGLRTPTCWALSALGGVGSLVLWLTPLGDKLVQWLCA